MVWTKKENPSWKDDVLDVYYRKETVNESKELKEAFNSSDIADWLEDHEQAAEDCKTFFKIDDLSKVRKDRLISWISDHDTLAQDFETKFKVKLDGETSLKEGWTVFEFTSGSNPYIAKTDKEVKRLLKKYKGRVDWDEYNGKYIVDDKERFGWDKPMVDDDPLPFGPGAPLKEAKGKKVYVVVELPMDSDVPKLIGVYSSKSAAEKVANSERRRWCNVIETTLEESLTEAINPKFQAFYDKVNSDRQLAKQVDYLYSKVLKTLHYDMDEIRREVKNRALEDKVAEILEHASLISDQPNSKLAKELNALLDESLKEEIKDKKPYIVAYLGKEIASFDYPSEARDYYEKKTYQGHTVEGYWWGLRSEMPSDLGWKPLPEEFESLKEDFSKIQEEQTMKLVRLLGKGLITKQEFEEKLYGILEPKLVRAPMFKNTKIKDFYTDNYPEDDLGEEINDTVTVQDVVDLLNDGRGDDFYSLIGVSDSLVRERIFAFIADACGVKYEKVYDKWLGESLTESKKLTESLDNVDMQKFVDSYKNNYELLSDGINEDAIEFFDRWVAKKKHDNFMKKFAEVNGDYVSSDREAVAFAFTLEDFGLIFESFKTPKKSKL